ncbi:MAG: hypothetical protein ACRDAS_12355 [Cetobacterium sp.]
MLQNKQYKEAELFIRSLRLAHYEVRMLKKFEIDFILDRAKELRIPNVENFIKLIKNKKIIQEMNYEKR